MLLLLNIFEDDQHDHSLSVDHLPPMGGHLAGQHPFCSVGHMRSRAGAPCGAPLVDASATRWIIAGCTRIRRTFPRITNERLRLNGLRLFGGPEPRATTCR